MNDELDEMIRGYFADRGRPSGETRAVLHEKLLVAERRRGMRRDWLIMAYALIFSVALTVAAWAFTGTGAIVCLFLSNLFLTIIGGVAITIVCQKERIGRYR